MRDEAVRSAARPGGEVDLVPQPRSATRSDVTRVLLVDDQVMLTEALSAHLSATRDVWVVGQCGSADPALESMVTRLRPDLVLVDVEPWGASARERLARLRGICPNLVLTVLTASRDRELAVEVARAGVSAWLPKNIGAEELTEMLRAVRGGQAWFPPDVLGLVLRELRQDVDRARERSGPLEVLSAREREVLAAMVAGKRGLDIASLLHISVETVRTHIRSILGKLDVHSQLEAVAVACAAGMRPGERGAAPVSFPAP